jgi:hypothetical protein
LPKARPPYDTMGVEDWKQEPLSKDAILITVAQRIPELELAAEPRESPVSPSAGPRWVGGVDISLQKRSAPDSNGGLELLVDSATPRCQNCGLELSHNPRVCLEYVQDQSVRVTPQ